MNNYEIKDFEEVFFKKEKQSRKIKFKKLSFLNIGRKFDEFRARRLEKKLVKAKEKLANSQFFEGDLKADRHGVAVVDRVLAHRTKAVANLEAKIDFLRTGDYPDQAEVDSHAIKLRNNMMENLRKNIYGLYSVPEENKENIYEEEPQNYETDTEKVIKEETDKLQEKINSIQQEPTEEEIRKSIDESLNNIRIEDEVNVNEVKEAVENSFDKKEENISFDDLSNIIENNLAEQESTNNNVDGEYSLTGDQIIQDLPITPFKKIQPIEIAPLTLAKVAEKVPEKGMNDDIFSTDATVQVENKEEEEEERDLPIVVEERDETDYLEKTLEGINKLDSLYEELGSTSMEDVEAQKRLEQEITRVTVQIIDSKEHLTEEQLQELEEKTQPKEKVVEEKVEEVQNKPEVEETKEEENISFDYSEASEKDLETALESPRSSKDLGAMMQRARILQEEVRKTEEARLAQIKANEEKERQYNETVEKFTKYIDEMEAKANQNLQETVALSDKVSAKDEEINTMLEFMNKQAEGPEKKK